jgi:uncharacterized protein (TIGR02594 family)
MSGLLQYVQAHGPLQFGMLKNPAVMIAQQALLRDGRELVADGDYLTITVTAVTKFQMDHGLQPLGFIGPKTAAALDAIPESVKSIVAPLPSVLKVAPWLSQMRAMNGLHEGVGNLDNPAILAWPREIANKYPDLGPDVLWYTHDSIAWCGLGMGICATRGGEKPPAGLLGAGNWANFGQHMSLSQRTPGAVFVYSRVGGHHVTAYESEDETHYYCRGANQSDSICVTKIPKSRAVVAVRWGIHFPIPTTGPKHGATANAVMASEA